MALSREEIEALKILGGMLLGGMGAGAGAGGLAKAATKGGFNGKVFGPGFAARPNGRVWVKEGERNDGGVNQTSIGAAEVLAKARLSEPIDFDAGIIYVPGPEQNNRMLVRDGNLQAFIRQSAAEHDALLNQYMNDPNIPKDRAARLGIRNEENEVKWWNDKDPRRPVTPSSSCVKRARIGSNGDIYITFGSNPNKEYQYEGSPDPVKASKILYDLVTAPSIGRDVNSWSGDWGTRHTYLPKS